MTEPTPAEDPAAKRIRVLIVEDYRLVADMLGIVLAAEPSIQVVANAGSAVEALRLFAEHEVDVVLMGHRLPELDGMSTAKELRRQRPSAKVVLMMNKGSDRILREMMAAGCSGYLDKRVEGIDSMVMAIRGAHSGALAISPEMLAKVLRVHAEGDSEELSDREVFVLEGMAQGLSNDQIAGELFVSKNTVRNYIHAIVEKLDCHSKLEAVMEAFRRGIIEPPS